MQNLLTPNKIIYSACKSIALIIDRDGNLIVRAPKRCSEAEILKFITTKSNWIITKRSEILNSSIHPFDFYKNPVLPILGEQYNAILYNGKSIKLEGKTIFVPDVDSLNKLKKYLIKIFKKIILDRVNYFSKTYNFNYKSITITSAKTRWGSCGYHNTLNFTYKLVLCPIDVIDYIVVHELCHTIEKNHSHKFWHRVETILPNYKTQEKWLNQNKKIIDII